VIEVIYLTDLEFGVVLKGLASDTSPHGGKASERLHVRLLLERERRHATLAGSIGRLRLELVVNFLGGRHNVYRVLG
jgi:hypothetical protein